MKTTKEIPAKLKDFTPLLDSLVQKYDVITASVWGRVWRYTQGKNGVCQASIETIATELNIGERTVIRKLQQLVTDGYLVDHTPELRNRPHTYSTTDQAGIEIIIQGVSESHTKNQVGLPESHSTLPQSHSGSVTESHEDTKKKEIKKEEAASGIISPVKKCEACEQETDNLTLATYHEHRFMVCSECFIRGTLPMKIRPPKNAHARRVDEAILNGARKTESISDDCIKYLRFSPNWRTKDNVELMTFLKACKEAGQTVETFSRWYWENHWKGKQRQTPNSKDIRENWYAAFNNLETGVSMNADGSLYV